MWLGAAEAPTKLVTIGLSPFAVSLWMVAGVFTARWTFPTLLKGTAYVWRDLKEKKHLLVWALLAGALWAVANTLTVFAIRDVGLAIAFPPRYRWVRSQSLPPPSCSASALCMAAATPRRMQPAGSLRPSEPARCGAPCMCRIARRTSAA